MKKIEIVKNNIWLSVKFFPIASILASILTVLGSKIIMNPYAFENSIIEVVSWLIVGFFLYVLAALHQHSFSKKGIVFAYISSSLLWVYLAYEFFILTPSEALVLFKSFFVSVVVILAYIYMPLIKNRNDNLTVLMQVHQVRYALFRALPFVLLLGIGLIIINLTLNFLFNIKLDKFIGLIAFNASFGIFLYIFFVTLMKDPSKLKVDMEKYKLMGNRYVTGLLHTFSIIIFTALNLFVLKILFTQELPKGQISWLVMGFSFFAFMSYLSLVPYKAKIKKYNTFLWGTLLLQSLVLLGSISIRIYEYGITEKRYLLLAYGLWLFFISIYFVWKKEKAKIFWLFSSLSMLILLSQIGPINGYSISKYSQQQRFTKLLENYKKAVNEKKYPFINELDNVYNYLERTHGKESIKELFPQLDKNDFSSLKRFLGALGIEENMKKFMKQHNMKYADRHYKREYHDGYHVKDYDVVFIKQNKVYGRKSLYLDENRSLFIDSTDKNISITIVDDIMVFDMEELIKPLMKLEYINYLEDEKMTLIKESKNYKVKIIFNYIWSRHLETKVSKFSMDIYVSAKDENENKK